MLYFCSTLEEYKNLKSKLKSKKVGLVPTMGNLHEGHMSLVERSLSQNDLTVVSIFVNPKQFARGEDFDTYPRSLEQDLQKIEKKLAKLGDNNKSVIAFAPKNDEEVYPKGFSEHIKAGKLGKILEGELRPEHFDGVVTVVKRLFTMLAPDNAYFEKKDFQQFTLIKLMTEKEGLKLNLEGLQTVRESSGLAMSSRNGYLSKDEKELGLNLYKKLKELEQLLKKEKSIELARDQIKKTLKEDSSFNYLDIRNANDLTELKDLSVPVVILGNYQVNKVRLIDNMEVEVK